MRIEGRRAHAVTKQGPMRGKLLDKGRLASFNGVPYAAPPVGAARWAPPRPHDGWTDERDCLKPSAKAWQRATLSDEFFQKLTEGLGLAPWRRRALSTMLKVVPQKQDEDCLYLNVRAPVNGEALPVLVWIHGGDHTDGSGHEPMYEGRGLAGRDAVVVTINYRLGMFGFFAHPDLAEESSDGVSGNYGLLDQIAALEWVRDNIAEFGGDPDCITIFGESAGGQAVLNLMTAPKARGLFHRAIAQSPSDSGRWLHLRRPVLDFTSAESAGQRFADLVVGEGDGQLARLRSISAETLTDHYQDNPHLGRYFYPCVDGAVLPMAPMTAFSLGAQAPVPFVIGYNADEGSLLAEFMHPAGGEFEASDEPDIRATFIRSYGSPEQADRLLAAYPGLAEGEPEAVLDHVGDHMFGVHVDHASRHHAAAGHPVYRYHYRSVPASPTQTAGAFHAAEVLNVFGTSFPLVPAPEGTDELDADMGDRWVEFARTGSPNLPGRVDWPRYESSEPRHMVFDRPTSAPDDCPAQPGLDIMRERIDHLSAAVAD